MSGISDRPDASNENNTDQMPNESKTDTKQELAVLYDDLREQGAMSDFTIKVGEKDISVHRKTITTHSEYFRAMLAHDTKEKRRGFVEVKDVTGDSAGECIDFMYTGKFNINDKNVEDILKIADMWQLSKVHDACSKFLKNQLNSGNCVSTLYIVTKYSCLDFKETAQQLYSENFDVEITELLQFSKDEVVKYLEFHTVSNKVAWDAMITWIKNEPARRGENIHELVETLYKNDFPSSGLLENMWAEPMFRSSSQCKEFLFEKIFLDLEVFKRSLDVESYFVLKEISNEFKYVMKQIKDLLSDFFKRQIVLLSQKNEFKFSSSEEMLQLFSRDKPDIFAPEKWWWNIAIAWVKHDPERKKLFLKLMSFIKFDQMPITIARSLIQNEPLVKESQENFDIILDSLLAPKHKNNTYIACLYSDGRIRALNISTKLWNYLPPISTSAYYTQPIIFNFNSKLCCLNRSKLFYLQHDEWMERSSMNSNRTTQNIAIDGENLYIGGKNLLRFNSIMDKWTEIEFPENFGTLNSIAAFGGCVYVGSSNKTMFILKDTTWTTAAYDSSQSNEHCIAIEDKIFRFGQNRTVYKFDLYSGRTCLQPVPTPTTNDEYEYMRNGYYKIIYAKYVPPDVVYAVFQHNNRLAVVCGEKIYFYDDICNNWSSFVDVPKFVTGTKGGQKDVCVTSACSVDL